MESNLIKKVVGDKRRWREYKARARRLPASYGSAVDAIERYLMYFGPADGDSAASMFEELADLFERAAADGTPVRVVVGQDPVQFVEAFAQNYSTGGWVPPRARKRLITAIDRAATQQG